MAKAAVTRSIRDDHQKNFLKIFNGLTGKHSRWEIWEDFVTLTAIEISNSTDKVNAAERTKMYQTIVSKYSAKERDGMAEMLAEVVMGMEQNPDQDFLGSLYMMCELGNDHAGQFFTLRAWGADEAPFLSRPISVHRWNPDSSTIEFLYQVVGEGTEKLAQLKQQDTFQLTGPMGNGFDVPEIVSKYKKIAVVGGGIGTAPMYQLTRELAAAGVKPDVFFGFRDAPYCMEEYREIANLVKVSTDTGAVGFHGFVTQLYDPADYDVVLVCGPTVMMRNAARLCAEKGTPCFVSMEKKMACGIGACLGCTCETKSGEGKSVCKNGPVFDATEVFF